MVVSRILGGGEMCLVAEKQMDGPRGRLGLLVRVAGSSSKKEGVAGEQRGKGSTSQGLWTKPAEYGQLGIDIGWA